VFLAFLKPYVTRHTTAGKQINKLPKMLYFKMLSEYLKIFFRHKIKPVIRAIF
jgi:hypothetical protein